MKILIITLEYPPQVGGVASYVYNFAVNWKKDDVVVYAPKHLGDIVFDQNQKFKVVRCHPFFSFFWPRWLKLLLQVVSIIKKEKISLLHVHHVLPVGYVAYISKLLFKTQYNLFFHGTDLETSTKSRWKKKMFKLICFGASKVIVNSEFLKNKLLSHLDGFNLPVVVIYPCPGSQFFIESVPDKLSLLRSQLALEGKKVILTVARMDEGKGYPHLIRLLPQIMKKIPNLVWIVIGLGKKKDFLIQEAQKNGLQNVVRFLGEVPNVDLPDYFHLADVFVLLTHADNAREEGWGTVFVEAAACGVPVIAGRCGGVEEAVQSLVSGLLVDVHQDQAVISAIVDLLREETFRKNMGVAAKERAQREFQWKIQLNKLD